MVSKFKTVLGDMSSAIDTTKHVYDDSKTFMAATPVALKPKHTPLRLLMGPTVAVTWTNILDSVVESLAIRHKRKIQSKRRVVDKNNGQSLSEYESHNREPQHTSPWTRSSRAPSEAQPDSHHGQQPTRPACPCPHPPLSPCPMTPMTPTSAPTSSPCRSTTPSSTCLQKSPPPLATENIPARILTTLDLNLGLLHLISYPHPPHRLREGKQPSYLLGTHPHLSAH